MLAAMLALSPMWCQGLIIGSALLPETVLSPCQLPSCPLAPSYLSMQARSIVVRRASVVEMAGFGSSSDSTGKKGGSKKATKPASKLSMKRQWERFKELVSNGAPRVPVYARIGADGTWTSVGDVACEDGIDAAAAVQLHKRLILEHAARVSPKLALQAKNLECGYSKKGDQEPQVLQRVEAAKPSEAGFEGAPDPSARYSALSNLDAVKQMDEASSKLNMGGY